MTVRFAVMGYGRIGERHARLLADGLVAGASLAGIVDIDGDARDRASARGLKVYGSPDELLRNVEADVFSVCTPSGSHSEHTIALAGCKKHVVVEKPMALTLEQADEMIEACDTNGVRLFVVKQNRFNAPIVALKQALEDGWFGRVSLATVRVRWCRDQSYYDQAPWRGTWELDGGVLANQASHHIDILEWLMGPVESVAAMSATRLVEIETEDTAVAVLRFKSGALGVVEATTATRPENLEGSVSVLGESGSVVIGGTALNAVETWCFTDPDRNLAVPADEEIRDVYGLGHGRYLEHVVSCLTRGEKALVEGLEGRKSLELITAIYESIEARSQIQVRFAPRLARLGRPTCT